MSEVKIKLAAGTNVGLIRQNNEDNFVVSCDLSASKWLVPQADEYIDLGEYGALLTVADGMGGANAGEVASAIAVETIQSSFVPENLAGVVSGDKHIQEFMKDVVRQADQNILQRSSQDNSTKGMGTTIVMAWILGDKAYICWCGDSRCYVLNKRYGLVRLSKDHSFVQELIDNGELLPEYASDHPLANVVTRCLGDVDSRAEPETRVYQLHDGDTVMLCSDGLCGLCADEQILDILIEFRENPTECKNELISAALSKGGYDNVTVVICNIVREGDEQTDENYSESIHPDGEMQKQEEESLSTTVRSECIGHKKKLWRLKILLFLLLILGCAFAYVYFFMITDISGSRLRQWWCHTF